MGRLTIKQALASGTDTLSAAAITATPLLEAEVLLAAAVHRNRTELWTYPEREISGNELKQFEAFLQRRKKAEPVAYIVEEKEFFGLPLSINRHTLIPRPETEVLVEEVLLDFQNTTGELHGIDVGTGSGAIAIALSTHLPQLHMTAVDHSAPALGVCKKNILRAKLTARVTPLHSNLLARIKTGRKFDIVACNLPYLSEERYQTTSPDVRYEPKEALVASQGGLGLYSALLQQLPRYLMPHSMVYLEADPHQIPDLTAQIRSVFPKADVTIFADLAHDTRFVKFRAWQ